MELTGENDDRLTNYYHKMADAHVQNKNYKSAYVFYSEAAEKYYQASKMAYREDLVEDMKDKCQKVLQKGEIWKKRHKESLKDMNGELNKSLKVKLFKHLSLNEQKYVFENMHVYKDLAKSYTAAFGKTKDNQFLHAVFESNKQAAFAYILGSKYSDDDILCLKWNAEGRKLLDKTEALKEEISQEEKYDKWDWLKKKYTTDERLVINRSSIFNGMKVNAWLVEDGVVNIIQERVYHDPDGFPALSESQNKHFAGFKRPRDFVPKKFKNPVINVGDQVSGFEVNQNSVGDCSVVASLALSAHLESKLKYSKRIVTWNIYPQDKYRNPIYNPFGQYVIKLYVNGLWRAVKIDDFFPVDHNNNLLCSHSTKGKLWWSLLEKAYLKMCNGYNFGGSNTSRDLFIFTSWLPERKTFEKIEDLENLWDRLVRADKTRDVMVSISTGNLPNADDLGLVENHAYAVLEFMEFEDKKFVLVLNPWGRFYWKGEYSIDDKDSWTPAMKEALHYDYLEGKDKGLFWIQWETMASVFEIIEMNWNPSMLSYSSTKFGLWRIEDMVDGFEDLSKTPQFVLKYMPKEGDLTSSTYLWVVLSRLILDDNEDFSEEVEKDHDYISVHLLENKHKGGVLHKMKNILQKNVFTTELTYTFRIHISEDLVKRTLSLIVAQDSRKKDLYYSMKLFSNVNFALDKAESYENQYEIPIEQEDGGGTPNDDSFYMNPHIFFKAKKSSTKRFNWWLSYNIHGYDTAVKVFLMRTDKKERIEYITTDNQVGDDDTPYYNKNWATHFILNRDQSYMAVVSSFNKGDPIPGIFSIKANVPVTYKVLDPL